MAEEYSNDTAKANGEMVTEIQRGDAHPFPIPKDVMREVRDLREVVRPIGQPMGATFAGLDYAGLTFMGEWETSLTNLSRVAEALEDAAISLDQPFSVVVANMALDNEIRRQWGLWKWTRATWKYDPAVLALSGKADEQTSPEEDGGEA